MIGMCFWAFLVLLVAGVIAAVVIHYLLGEVHRGMGRSMDWFTRAGPLVRASQARRRLSDPGVTGSVCSRVCYYWHLESRSESLLAQTKLNCWRPASTAGARREVT